MQLELIETTDGLTQIEDDWQALHDAAGAGPFSHPAWVGGCYRNLPRGDMLLVAVFASSKRLVGVFPFAIEPFRIKHLQYRALVHGCSGITDYARFLIHPEFNARLMIKRVLNFLAELDPERWQFLKIENLNDSDDHSKLFLQLSQRELYAGTAPEQITPGIDFCRAFEEPKKVANIRRRFRDLSDKATLRIVPGGEIEPQQLAAFCDIQRQTFPNAAFGRDDTQVFIQSLLADERFAARAELAILELDGAMIAAHFGFFDAQRYYYWVPTFDRDYAKQGAGQYLLLLLVQQAQQRSLVAFDLLRGDERYKFDWANVISTNHTLLAVRSGAGKGLRLLVNLWLLTRTLPHFINRK